MAKKKVTKKKTTKKSGVAPSCPPTNGPGSCKPLLALVIIALTWWKPAVLWSQIVITVAAAIIFLAGDSCFSKKK